MAPAGRTCSSPSTRSMTACFRRRSTGSAAVSRECGALAVVYEVHARMFGGAREHFGFADGFSQPAIEGVNEDATVGEGVPDCRRLATARARRIHCRPRGRGIPHRPPAPAAERAQRSLRTQRHVHGVAQGTSGRGAVPALRQRGESPLQRGRRREAHGQGRRPLAKWRAPGHVTRCATGPFRPPLARHECVRLRQRGPERVWLPPRRPCAAQQSPRQPRLRRQARRSAIASSAAACPTGLRCEDGVLEDDGEDRGLVFVCFNASISRQFESIQRQWLNDGNTFHLGDDRTTSSAAPLAR